MTTEVPPPTLLVRNTACDVEPSVATASLTWNDLIEREAWRDLNKYARLLFLPEALGAPDDAGHSRMRRAIAAMLNRSVDVVFFVPTDVYPLRVSDDSTMPGSYANVDKHQLAIQRWEHFVSFMIDGAVNPATLQFQKPPFADDPLRYPESHPSAAALKRWIGRHAPSFAFRFWQPWEDSVPLVTWAGEYACAMLVRGVRTATILLLPVRGKPSDGKHIALTAEDATDLDAILRSLKTPIAVSPAPAKQRPAQVLPISEPPEETRSRLQIKLEGEEKALAARIDAVLGMHRGERGRRRESHFREFLRAFLPREFGVSDGEVLGPDEDYSPQLDAIVYRSHSAAPLEPSVASQVFHLSEIYSAIEIRTELRVSDMQEIVDKARSFNALVPADWLEVRRRVYLVGERAIQRNYQSVHPLVWLLVARHH